MLGSGTENKDILTTFCNREEIGKMYVVVTVSATAKLSGHLGCDTVKWVFINEKVLLYVQHCPWHWMGVNKIHKQRPIDRTHHFFVAFCGCKQKCLPLFNFPSIVKIHKHRDEKKKREKRFWKWGYSTLSVCRDLMLYTLSTGWNLWKLSAQMKPSILLVTTLLELFDWLHTPPLPIIPKL